MNCHFCNSIMPENTASFAYKASCNMHQYTINHDTTSSNHAYSSELFYIQWFAQFEDKRVSITIHLLLNY